MRLVILCEGQTEKLVLKDFLRPYTVQFSSVNVYTPGGNTKLLQEYKRLAETELESDPSCIVFCLIDLLEAPFNYPRAVAQAIDPSHAQYEYVRQYMSNRIDAEFRERFHVFPVIMELETWLLADVEALRTYFRSNQISGWNQPESVNYPAEELRSLTRQFQKSPYVKTLSGRSLFKLASAERVYNDSCPHFEQIINQLLKLQGYKPVRQTLIFQIPNQELYMQLADLQQTYDSIFDDAELNHQYDFNDDIWKKLLEIDTQIQEISSQLSK